MAAKKTKKKSQAITRSEIHIMGLDAPILLRESYATVKGRLLNSLVFVEFTSKNGRKFILNKADIKMVHPYV